MRQRIFRILRHVFTLLFFLAFPLVFFSVGGLEKVRVAFSTPLYWLFWISLLSLTYFNYYVLIPKFYLRKKYALYSLIIFSLFVFFFLLKPFELMMHQYYLVHRNTRLQPNEWFAIDLFTCSFFIIFVTTGIAVRYYSHARDIERKALIAEAEKANAELSFLKAQVNPHFLFNTLNNIYSLSEDQHPDTSESIMKLSNIMRYITDEATKDFVPLEDELAIIRDYIDLQQLRLGENIKIDFSLTGDTANKQIAPLILITYIENAFKYGISSREKATITISIRTDEEKISMECRNKIFPVSAPKERTGIGLMNTRQRLQYLYPKKHDLTINADNGYYSVELTLFA